MLNKNEKGGFVWITLLALSLSGASCTQKEPVAPASRTVGQAIQVQVSAEPLSLDPTLIEDGNGLRLIANLMDGLVGYDGGGRLRFLLAESVKNMKGGLRYEFTLRKDAKWSDGRPVHPDDFVVALRRAVDPTTGSKLADLLEPIRGARDVRRRLAPLDALGVSVVDSRTLAIELERPNAAFLETLTLPQALPLRADVLAAHGGRWPLNAPVTGAYRVAVSRLEESLWLEPNREHWEFGSLGHEVHPVLLRVVADETTAGRLFDTGKIDILSKVPVLEQSRYEKAGKVQIFPWVATYFLAFDVTVPPFNDVMWRRRFSAAIDREGIVKALGSGEKAATGWVSRGLEGAKEGATLSSLLQTALSGANPRIAAGLGAIALGFDSGAKNAMILEKVQSDLLKNLGMKIELRPGDWKTHVRNLSTRATAIFRFGWLAPFIDPISHLKAFTSDNPNNYTGWKSDVYDAMVSKVSTLPHGPERESWVRKADELLTSEEAVVVPLFHYVQSFAISSRVQGFRANPTGVIRFSELTLQK